MDRTTPAQIIKSLSEELKAHYVSPDVAGQICARLQEHLDCGDYADISEGEFLALALTLHMQEVNQDEHLWVRWHPDPLPDHEGPLRHNQAWLDERKLEAGLDNYGLHRVERLPGNVGYIDIRSFHRPAWGGDTAVAAMSFLAHTSALIIDLRSCTGGYPGMIALLSSYLLGEEPVHLNDIYWRDEDLTQQYWTLPYVPGKRYLGKPVYVLTSEVTFSGGEEFASILRNRRRAILIGEKTDGGAHPGAAYRLNSHFEVFIPIGRAIDPTNGSSWEGTGVTPDIAVPQEQAFKIAYKIALKSVLANIGESPAGPFKALAAEVQSALDGLETA